MNKPKELNQKHLKDLYKAILKLRNTNECQAFFRDLCTVSELNAMTERWEVAKQLNKNEPYRNVAAKTGSSTATITRVASWLHHGQGGYRLMLHRLS